MREAYRLQKTDLHHQLKQQQKKIAVFFIYVGKELPVYEFIFEKTNHVLAKLIKITDAKT